MAGKGKEGMRGRKGRGDGKWEKGRGRARKMKERGSERNIELARPSPNPTYATLLPVFITCSEVNF